LEETLSNSPGKWPVDGKWPVEKRVNFYFPTPGGERGSGIGYFFILLGPEGLGSSNNWPYLSTPVGLEWEKRTPFFNSSPPYQRETLFFSYWNFSLPQSLPSPLPPRNFRETPPQGPTKFPVGVFPQSG
jgi:hypothetical protein